MEHIGLVSLNITQAKPRRSIDGAGRYDENMGVLRWAEVAKWLVTRLSDMGMGQNPGTVLFYTYFGAIIHSPPILG